MPSRRSSKDDARGPDEAASKPKVSDLVLDGLLLLLHDFCRSPPSSTYRHPYVRTPPPPCPTNAVSNEHFRSDCIFLGHN